jgi:peptidyl-prolyl cis-trans isomerase D
MLDIMRRKKRLKVVLWLVIIGLSVGMLVFFVPGQNLGGAGLSTSVAQVDDEAISRKEFEKVWRRVLEQYGAGGKNPLEPKMMKTLGLDRQALDLLINTRVIDYAAKKLGLDVSPEEIRRAVETNPNLQGRGGVFVGIEQYKAILQQNGISVTEFEESLRGMLLSRKIRNVVADSMELGEKELRDEFVRTKQEAQVRFVLFNKDDLKKKFAPKEPELRAYFEANKARFAIKEQRRVQYLLFSLDKFVPLQKVTEAEILDRWAKEPKDETVDASHILVEVKDPAKEPEAKAKAEGLLKRAKAGEDFAELAKNNSDDKGSAAQGGNLGSFPREKMVKEFSDAAFSMKPGEISGLVRSQFGFHIIKVLRHDTPSLENMRKNLERGIAFDKASEMLKKKTAEAERLSQTQKDLNAVLKGVDAPGDVLETAFVSRETDPIPARISQQLLDEIFRLKQIGEVGKVMDHPQGYAIPKLLETKMPKPAEFAEARAEVEKAYTEEKLNEMLRTETTKLSDEAIKLGDLDKAAQSAKLTVKDSLSFKRSDVPAPEIGNSPAFASAAFDLAIGAVSKPITIDANKAAVLQVKSRSAFDEAEFQKQKGDVRNQMLGSWQDAYFNEYIRRVTEGLDKAGKIRVNQRAIDAVTGLESS